MLIIMGRRAGHYEEFRGGSCFLYEVPVALLQVAFEFAEIARLGKFRRNQRHGFYKVIAKVHG